MSVGKLCFFGEVVLVHAIFVEDLDLEYKHINNPVL